MSALAGAPPALVAFKGTMTLAVMYATEHLRNNNHRKPAMAWMVASHALMSAVAIHNAHVLRTR